MPFQDVLKTRLQGPRTRAAWEDKRKKRILEALNWESGTENEPRKHLVTILLNGAEVYFLKPGKEVFNKKRPNPYDMFPVVGSPDTKLRFDDVWSLLSKIALIDFESFKVTLTMIYRSAYFLDHVEKEPGVIRFEPNEQITERMDYIDSEIRDVWPIGLMDLLHFLDILGWNEDMKYHVENNSPTFSGKYGYEVGRINTLLTCVRVPYQGSLFVMHCVDRADNKKNIDFSQLYIIMQQFAKSRGTCTPTQQQLVDWLSPYVVRGENLTLRGYL
jgi:hypothetical protein